MKRLIEIVLAFILGCNLIYPAVGYVDDIQQDEQTQTVTVCTSVGHRYSFYADGGDYDIGDTVAMLMMDTGIIGNVTDDAIVTARYAG